MATVRKFSLSGWHGDCLNNSVRKGIELNMPLLENYFNKSCRITPDKKFNWKRFRIELKL